MHDNYLAYRQGLKLKSTQPAAAKKRYTIPQKSAKRIEQEKQEKLAGIKPPPRSVPAKKSDKKKAEERAEIAPNGKTKTSNFFNEMIEAAPVLCMETDQPLANTAYNQGPAAVVCHILPKRKTSLGGVPSMAKNPLNIVYLDGEVHDLMDADMGTKSQGNYIRAMRIWAPKVRATTYGRCGYILCCVNVLLSCGHSSQTTSASMFRGFCDRMTPELCGHPREITSNSRRSTNLKQNIMSTSGTILICIIILLIIRLLGEIYSKKQAPVICNSNQFQTNMQWFLAHH